MVRTLGPSRHLQLNRTRPSPRTSGRPASMQFRLTLGSRITPGWRLYQSCRRPTFGCTTLMPLCAAAEPCTKLRVAGGGEAREG